MPAGELGVSDLRIATEGFRICMIDLRSSSRSLTEDARLGGVLGEGLLLDAFPKRLSGFGPPRRFSKDSLEYSAFLKCCLF